MAESEGKDPESSNVGQPVADEYKQGPKPDPGGETAPGGLVPPYEGRKRSGEVGDYSGGTERGATGPAVTSSPSGQGLNQTASPADEHPAQPQEGSGTYEGVGPAHVPGTRTGEGESEGKSDEELKEGRRGMAPSTPSDPSMPDQGT
jgi:hypothetical protein